MSTNITRITGMYSGFDTDQLISDLIKAESVRIDKVKQDKIYAEWQQEEYRDIINSLRSFKDEFFDYANPDTNFRSSNAFTAFSSTVQINGTDTSYVAISADSSAQLGSHTLNDITLAKKSIWESSDTVSAKMTGSDITSNTINKGETFDLILDGNRKTITIPNTRNLSTAGELTNLVSDLQAEIDDAFGSGNITVAEDGSKITFTSAGHTLQIANTNEGDGVVGSLGFTTGEQNTLDLSNTLQDANFGQSASGTVEFTINGESFSFNAASDTVQEVINQVNSSDAGVTLSYSSLTDKFTLKSNSAGKANDISFSDTSGNFLGTTLGLAGNEIQDASDAQFTLDGITTTRSSNSFNIDGVEYTLKSDYSSAGNDIDISVNSNPDDLVDKIKGFVDKYNDLIDDINTKLTEKRYYDFDPLTEDQKKELTEDEVEQWEEKARSGILRSDSTLQSLVRNMRSALYESVDGLGLYNIGITTSSSYSDKGKLIIDEDKLKDAIEDNPSQVANLFSKDEEGLAHKLYDILEDNITTKTDSDGRKGILLEKAGIEGDRTVNQNILSEKISDYDDRITELLEELNDKETYYYQMFAKMESALAEMNSQASFFMGQMG